ncbi:hypothetical protein SRABI80_02095 [Peribacillus frigoritolerans]|uniref:Uncharacterized protein n=1 Tax=Peribacillus simplex TaxID=1478 RepID=A0AAN2TSC0_9BACI|nr:hypothetical protein COF64_23135 [Bacillus sp. AFS043905]CAH0212650.1 hypothetical protein SRABI80_02095 [Peribacillus frigoritolerans]CEG31978.1 hypothetical protein BN1180_02135 [Peribacillus simplex]
MSNIVIGAVFIIITMVKTIRNKEYIWLICLLPVVCLIVFSLTDILDFIPKLLKMISSYILFILTIIYCVFYSMRNQVD